MSFGGGGSSKPAPVVMPPPAPRRVDPSTTMKAREDLKLRLRRASSRKKSRVTLGARQSPGLLTPSLGASLSAPATPTLSTPTTVGEQPKFLFLGPRAIDPSTGKMVPYSYLAWKHSQL